MLPSVLVANRGEIALRVIRTCRRLGIATIAVHSDADARAPHVRAADRSVRIGPGPAAESYLRGDVILAAAASTGAAAIHPGYGFLAENASFADAVIAAGLAWVGPPPAAMRALGDKSRAKALAESLGVPVLPGWHGASDGRAAISGTGRAALDEDAALVAAAARVGFPLLVKASAGGGGRGMRVVRTAGELPDALAGARREALAGFGDDRLLLERYVERPRHVEVQIVGDAHGTLVHLGERECSIQRRHQKLVEESPSPAVTPALRQAMGEASLRLGRAAGYTGAGTVEFLLDPAGDFWFLEVNARLQVEHPVTEAVTGLDLVELQLRVAAGERLGFGQDDVRFSGHAIEVRVVAEDVAAGFLPATGVVTAFDVPAGIRVDAGIEGGSIVSPFYDSLLAKAIAHGADREATRAALRDALDGVRIDGIATNLDLLAAVLDEPAFAAGDLHTGFLAEHRVAERLADVPDVAVAAAALEQSLRGSGAGGGAPAAGRETPAASDAASATTAPSDPWRSGVPWRLSRSGEPSRWIAGGRERLASVTLGQAGAPARVTVDGRPVDADASSLAVVPEGNGRFVTTVTLDGRRHRLRLAPPPAIDARHAGAEEPGALVAPMPGRIVRVAVAPGDRVRANDPLVVLEAMKMEHVISAAAPGRVSRLHVAEGDQVGRGATLVELEGSDPA